MERQAPVRRVDLLAGCVDDVWAVADAIRRVDPGCVWYIATHRRPDLEFDFLEQNHTAVDIQSDGSTDACLFKVEQSDP